VEDTGGLFAAPGAPAPTRGWDQVLFIASLVLLVLGGVWHTVAALSIQPWNPDTLMYRLPRVWWYIAQGSLRHFAESVDPRIIYYPFNVSLAYVPLALFKAPPVVFNLISVAAWAVSARVVFALARWIGASRGVSGFVTFLIAFAPIVFVEATSTNDEIIAAAGVVSGLYFTLRYFREGSRLCLAVAAAAFGCGLGAKLHFFFFWPAVAGLGVWFAVSALRNSVLREFVANRRRLQDLIVALAAAFLLSAPFLIYNRLSTPHFAYTGDTARNSPFSSAVAGQTIAILTGQLFLSPFPTFESSPKAKVQQTQIDAWNAWWNARLFPKVDQSERAMLATYRFQGVTDPKAGHHFENTEWIGLLPWFLVVCGVALIGCRMPYRWLALSLAVAMLAWWLSYCATMKYCDTVGVYTAYPLIVCGVFMSMALMPGRSRIFSIVAWMTAWGAALGNVALCRNIVLLNPHVGYGRVAAALQAGKSDDFSNPVHGLGPVLSGLKGATILLTHWAVPYYEMMKTAPGTPYFIANPGEPVEGPVLTPIQARSVFDGFMPVKVSLPADEGLVYLDTIRCSFGPELIFGDASSFRVRLPDAKSRYVIFQATVSERKAPDARVVAFSSLVLGAPDQKLKYRLTCTGPGLNDSVSDWRETTSAEFPIGNAPADKVELKIEVADAAGNLIGEAKFQPFQPAALRKYNEVSR
jgi:hypothetical protein